MNRTQQGWQQLMDVPFAGWIVGIAGLAILLATAFYVIGRVRGMAMGTHDTPANYLSEFRQLKSEGKLSEEEFQRVRDLTPLPELEWSGKSSPPGRPASRSEQAAQSPDFSPVTDAATAGQDENGKT